MFAGLFSSKKTTEQQKIQPVTGPGTEDAATQLADDRQPSPEGHNDSAMLVEERSSPSPHNLAELEQQSKVEVAHGDDATLSLRNHPESQSPRAKRPSSGEMSYSRPSESYPRKKRSLPSSTEEPSLVEEIAVEDGQNSLYDYQDGTEEDQGPPPSGLLRDLETRAITVSQLIQEVKGIYAGLVMVEKKCIEIVSQQSQNPTKLSKEQWQALIALHRTLLNEHHDFFSASHHPVTQGHELRELASRYAMPARMWRHGIHAFLELLRHRLPESLEHMLSFVYLSYSMMALLMETVPDFLETWIECLGDLARYRMAIEEADLRDREIWSNTARTWYDMAADLSPNTGRIQHHLAVLARPQIVQQLFLYSKALVAAVPFKNAGESILLLFNPLLDQTTVSTSRYQPMEFGLTCAAAIQFRSRAINDFQQHRTQFITHLEGHMARSGSRFKVQGVEIAGALFAMLMGFGNADNTLWNMLVSHQVRLRRLYCDKSGKEFDKLPKDFIVQDISLLDLEKREYWTRNIENYRVEMSATDNASPDLMFTSSDMVTSCTGPLLHETTLAVTGHIGNKNTVPYMHMVLANLHGLSWVPGALVYIEACVPWEGVAQFLNTVSRSGVSYENIEGNDFPRSYGGSKRQLPEDFTMRGLMTMTYYHKPGFFDKEGLVDEDERLLEQPSHQTPRVERCLWVGVQLASLPSPQNPRWLCYDTETKQFSATAFALGLYPKVQATAS